MTTNSASDLPQTCMDMLKILNEVHDMVIGDTSLRLPSTTTGLAFGSLAAELAHHVKALEY